MKKTGNCGGECPIQRKRATSHCTSYMQMFWRVCNVAEVYNLWAFYMAKHETPGSVVHEKLVAPTNCNSRRIVYGEQTEDQNKAESF